MLATIFKQIIWQTSASMLSSIGQLCSVHRTCSIVDITIGRKESVCNLPCLESYHANALLCFCIMSTSMFSSPIVKNLVLWVLQNSTFCSFIICLIGLKGGRFGLSLDSAANRLPIICCLMQNSSNTKLTTGFVFSTTGLYFVFI